GVVAVLYDQNRNRNYSLVQTRDHKFKVEDKFTLRSGKEFKEYKDNLELEDPDTQEKLVFQVVRIDLHDVILLRDGKYYLLHLGHSLKQAQLPPEEVLDEMGITPAKKEKPADPPRPPSDAKPGETRKTAAARGGEQQ